MSTIDRVRIVEVGPRDGLQNAPKVLPPTLRVELIRRLVQAGCSTIEAAAFVSPDWVPQMAQSADVLRAVLRTGAVRYSALVPNFKGGRQAIEAGADELTVFISASETFSFRNVNCSIDESVARAATVAELARQNRRRLRGIVSCAFGCPYEGVVAYGSVSRAVTSLLAIGCEEIAIADTIGVASAGEVRTRLRDIAREIAVERLAVHFHDTYGQGLSNILASIDLGIRIIDTSIAGLGGCPYAPGASGNVATEDVVYMLDGLGLYTGLDLDALIETVSLICSALDHGETTSRVARAVAATRRHRGPIYERRSATGSSR